MPMPAQDVCRSGEDAALRQGFASARKPPQPVRAVAPPLRPIVCPARKSYHRRGHTVTSPNRNRGSEEVPQNKRFVLTACIAGRNKQYPEAVKLLQPAVGRGPQEDPRFAVECSRRTRRGTPGTSDPQAAAVSLSE